MVSLLDIDIRRLRFVTVKLSLQLNPHFWHGDVFPLVVARTDFTQQVPSHMSPEELVSQSVDDGADKARQDLGNDVGGKAYGRVVLGQQVEQTLFKHGFHINKHA